MMSFEGTANGLPAKVTLQSGKVSVELDDKTHGPKPIVGSVKNLDKGAAWAIGLGSIRVRFVANDPEAFTRQLIQGLIGAQESPAELFENMYQMAPTVAEGIASMSRLLENITLTSEMLGEEPPDYSDTKKNLELLASRHREFMERLAPLGWTFSRVLDRGVPVRFYRVAAKFIEVGSDPDDVDEWLAPLVLDSSELERVVGEVAALPVRAIWQWAFLAGEAATATNAGLFAVAAEAWITIAEGLWRDLRTWLGGQGTFYRKGDLVNQTLTERLTQSWESLVVAHDYMSRSVNRTMLEPIDRAPTSRHALLHGRIAGAVRSVHAAKALTMIDGILEQAQEAIKLAEPAELETPPWIDGGAVL
ncbi:MAG: hypothetical protein P1T08_03335 [Acidimicrobiia bacterium]|nr:hypothetical protein [Acidimicrobiia bacterium]